MTHHKPFPFPLEAAKRFFNLALGCTAIFSVLQFLRGHSWLCAIFALFPLQYFFLSLIGCGLSSLQKQPKRACICFLLMLINLTLLVPFEPAHSPTSDGQPLTILHFNIYRGNRQVNRVTRAILNYNPDILSINEFTGPWQRAFQKEGLFKRYPYCLRAVRPDESLLLCSRYPLKDSWIRYDGPDHFPTIKATLLWHETSITLTAMHTVSPFLPRRYGQQLTQVHHTVHWLQPYAGTPMILIGDLNMAPWSPPFTLLEQGLHLRDTERETGLQPTWPLEFPPMMIPIDHVLVSPTIQVQRRLTGPWIGSDHLPVYVELQIPPPPIIRKKS